MVKQLLIIALLLLIFSNVKAQSVHGRVIDKTTGHAIPGATVKVRTVVTVTTLDGHFALNVIKWGDTLNVTCVGYKSYRIPLRKTDSLFIILLEPASIMLNQVGINTSRDYQADSLRNRKDFEYIFNYKAPGFKDAFLNKGKTTYTPDNYITSSHNTTELIGVNVLSVIDLLNKNKTPESHLQKIVIHNEEADYVDRMFSQKRVVELTALKNDSLKDFMALYRPTVNQTRKMTSYEMILYIKKSYTEFLKTYHH